VGAFKVDEAVPLLARYVGSLPAAGPKTSNYRDVAIHFPDKHEEARVDMGREPRGQTVMAFYADPSEDPLEQDGASEAATVLEAARRHVRREELGQTCSVSVGLSEPLPQRGAGYMQVRFGGAPENIESMRARVLKEIQRLQSEGPSEDLTNRAKENARRTYEVALRQNDYWLGRLQSTNMFGRDPNEILTRNARIDAITPPVLQDAFKRFFPMDRSTVVTLVPAADGR